EPFFLFRRDDLALEVAGWPPLLPAVETVGGLGEQHVAVCPQCGNVDSADARRPKSASAGLVFQVRFFVSGADEHALPGLDDFHAAVAWPVAIGVAGDECL